MSRHHSLKFLKKSALSPSAAKIAPFLSFKFTVFQDIYVLLSSQKIFIKCSIVRLHFHYVITPSLEKHQHLVRLIFFYSYMLLWFYVYSINFLLFITFCNQSATINIVSDKRIIYQFIVCGKR